MRHGFLLAIEGIDGSGKRSVSEALRTLLVAEGFAVSTYEFPDYSTPTGSVIAAHLRGANPELPAEAAAVLFAVDRLQSRDKLLNALEFGDVVIVDRYVASNAAYQAGRVSAEQQDDTAAWVEELEFDLMQMPRPSLTLLLDVDVRDSQRRTASRVAVGGRPSSDHYEKSKALLQSAAEQYRRLARSHEWHIVRASEASLDEVVNECWAAVQARIDA